MAQTTKQYDPQTSEQEIYKKWEESRVFEANSGSEKESFVISMPPPNATGKLHVGHALFIAIQDAVIRFQRMLGKEVLWLPGTDHAAIATENVVIRQLQKEEGMRDPRKELGREKLVARIQEYVEESRGDIRDQIRRMGASCDWSREHYTLEPALNRCVNEVFAKMYADGLIYRGHRIVHWDPKLQTNVSDDELEYINEKSPLYTFAYGPFHISTARPETKFGDKYVVMHPEDKRYAQYKHGDTFTCEWINGEVTATVIKDDSVDPEFGTGVMTITPWHDVTDFEIAERHKLDKEQIIDVSGKLLPVAGEFAGMSIEQARPKIAEKLKEKGLLVSVDETYEHNIATNSRGGGRIEPQIRLQWFIDVNKQAVSWKNKTMSLREVMKDVVVANDIQMFPERFENMYMRWVDNLRDWCISRQIWWGHRVPAWYKGEEIYVGVTPPHGEGWQQDNDTLDTWFSSALWTWSTLVDRSKADDPNLSLSDMLQQSPDFQKFHPTSLMETGYDILPFWVARMILMTTYATGQIPFKHVFLNGLVVAKTGKKMSKSDPSTAIDPLIMIEKYGADALRFGLLYQMGYDSQTIKLDEAVISSGRNFANKIWNMSRLLDSLEDRGDESLADAWIQQRFNETLEQVTQSLHSYRLGEALRTAYEFAWHDFADWYIEILKIQGSTQVAKDVFARTLALLHPFMPFLTENIWHAQRQGSMLIAEAWPKSADISKPEAVLAVEEVKQIVSAVRSARVLLDISPGSQIDAFYEKVPVLSTAIEKMARLQFVPKAQESMRRFPFASGKYILLGSDEITKDSLEKAKEKLRKELVKVEALLEQQKNTLQHMKGKAPQVTIDEKEKIIEQAEVRFVEIKNSLELLL